MKIEAHIEHGTLARLLRELAPIRIHMTPPDEGTRWLELEEPSLIQPVPGRGLRVQAAGRFRFDLWRLPLRFEIRKLGLVLEPVVVDRDGAPRLAFAIDLEDGDLVGIPRAIERPLIRRVNAALRPRDTQMVWGFTDTLSHQFTMPRRLEPVDSFSLSATSGAVSVDRDAIHFSVDLSPELHRHQLEPQDEGPAPAVPSPDELDPRILLGV